MLTTTLPASDFNFIDTTAAQRSIKLLGITGEDPAHQAWTSTFLNLMVENMLALARMYPQQDGDAAIYGQYRWLDGYANVMRMPLVSFNSDGNYGDAIDAVNDWLEPSGKSWAVALIDEANLDPASTYAGRGGIGSHTVAALNQTNAGGRIVLHEVLHGMGFVNANAANYLPNQPSGEDGHSKYNEGKWDELY
ncbi:MAG: hypothetical protein V9G13_13860 [Marmoricola sp.]